VSSKKTNIALITALALLLIIIGSLLSPIPQPQAYHHFADQRDWLAITNFQDVMSNIFFALVGFWGLYLFSFSGKVNFIDSRERWFWFGIAIGLILTAM
jgi:uncharacterized membrane protein YuzA (DUF378 family)